jgi:hypothetical protein
MYWGEEIVWRLVNFTEFDRSGCFTSGHFSGLLRPETESLRPTLCKSWEKRGGKLRLSVKITEFWQLRRRLLRAE